MLIREIPIKYAIQRSLYPECQVLKIPHLGFLNNCGTEKKYVSSSSPWPLGSELQIWFSLSLVPNVSGTSWHCDSLNKNEFISLKPEKNHKAYIDNNL